jgi:hypothetical protein
MPARNTARTHADAPWTSRVARRAARAALTAALAGLAGCAGHSTVERGIARGATALDAAFDGAAREERHYALPVDGVIDVDVETFTGDVVIRGGRPTGGQALMTIDVLARHGHERKDEGEASLREVEVRAEIVRGGDVPRLVLRGTTSHDEGFLHRTEIDIEVPEVRRVRVRTREGKVQVYENRGGCDVVTTDGEVRMFTPWAISEDVTIVNRGADIVVRAFNGTCGTFDVECVNGRVAARVESGDWRVLDRRNDHDTLHARLGNCTNRFLLRNVDAAVLVSVVDDPMEYGSLFNHP